MRGEHRLRLNRQIGPPLEAQHLRELQPCEVLEAAKHKRFIDAARNLFVAKCFGSRSRQNGSTAFQNSS